MCFVFHFTDRYVRSHVRAEACDGTASECPADVTLIDGADCDDLGTNKNIVSMYSAFDYYYYFRFMYVVECLSQRRLRRFVRDDNH